MSGAATRVADGGLAGRLFGRRLLATVLAAGLMAFAAPMPGFSAPMDPSLINMPAAKPGERMLVESDQLVYDYDHNTVSAVGNVKIYYNGYTLEAAKVAYNKATGRLIASGHVKLVDPSGAAVYSDYVDITDNFRDGFVQSLRVDSADHTHFGAASANRKGDQTTFADGSYTACEPCKQHPERPPLWDVKAEKIVLDQKEHMVYFTNATFQFFGQPIAWMPYFSAPDPTVTRKSGFLAPNFGYSQNLGFWGSIPYFWAIAPNMDMTFTPAYLTRQGFLGQVEFRHRLSNGQYTVRVAGINQDNPSVFSASGQQDFRAGINTTGSFAVAPDWTLGWNGTLLTDRTFTRDYGVLGGAGDVVPSTIYLTGLRDRNYFEARASYYQIVTDSADTGISHRERYDQGRQAVELPEIDSKKYADRPVLGGEFSVTSNLASLTRSEDDWFRYGADWNDLSKPKYFSGTAGNVVRLTEQADWKRQFIGPMGQVITPFAYLRGDAFYLDGQTSEAISRGLTSDSSAFRFMPAAGVDWKLPILVQNSYSTNIIEPRAQLIVRPNEMDAGQLPNNDAQSLVFDTSNLFDYDKFSGYDRVEGGTRLNLGVHYNGHFDNGASVDATFGQSFNLAGTNPYSVTDIAGVGGTVDNVSNLSGLASDASDYVAGATLDTGLGPQITASGRFDHSTFALNRGEVQATAAMGPVSASAAYLYLRHNPYNDNLAEASVVRGAGSINLTDNWRAFGSVIYDIAGTTIAGDSLGIAYDNDCLTFSLAYNETRAGYTDVTPGKWLTFRLQLRTFGDTSYQTGLNSTSN
jgi:LPS-assembly protein